MRPRSLTELSVAYRLGSMAAVAGLVLVATDAASQALVLPASRLVPSALVAAIPACAAAGLLARSWVFATIVLSVPATVLAAGAPAGALAPEGWHRLTAAGPLAPVMLVAGALWTAGAVLGPSRVARRNHARAGRLRTGVGFLLLAVPWLVLVSMTVPEHAAWQGGVVLVAAVLWFAGGRTALTLGVGSAVPATMLAVAIGPSSLWFGLGRHPASQPSFRTLETEPTYGPLRDRRTGATMLTITAPAPGLWRMQTLDYADGSWVLPGDRLPELPQPAARRETVQVRVVGLRDPLAVAPGRIERVSAGAAATAPISGEAMLLTPMPAAGSTYRVQAEYVQATAAQLSRDRAPLDSAARVYTRLVPATDTGEQLKELGWMAPLAALLSANRQPAPDRRVVALARRLIAGAQTEWDIVARVERYLLDGRRFRYTTNVPDPGPQPLVNFLLHTHAGYCQQFAGAAALLLRLAGVPARVVSGFATGRHIGGDLYAVRDLDAHEWIEVYFEGYGWVPFNPTPAADPALIAGGIDPLPLSSDPASGSAGLDLSLALIVIAAVGLLWALRRRRSTRASTDWFWHVARRAAGELEPSTTLTQLRLVLAARVGPRTAAIASQIERERFAGEPPVRAGRPRMRVARALLGDLGPLRSLLFWVWAASPQTAPESVATGQDATVHSVRGAGVPAARD